MSYTNSLKKPSATLKKRLKKHWFLYVLFLPIAVYYLIFHYMPIIMGVIISFKDLKIGNTITNAEWVGLKNYIHIVTESYMLKLIRNTIEISLLKLAFGFLPPIILAIMLFDMTKHIYKRLCQTVLYIPHFFSWVIIYGLVFAFFSSGTGFVNIFLDRIGIGRVDFLTSVRWFRPLLVASSIWKNVGWSSILYIAALTSINTELYEAAKIDGAGPLRRIIYITVPGILPIIGFVLTLSISSILGTDFEQILMFYNAAVYDVADVIDTWVYRIGLGKMQYSIGSAVGLMKALASMVLIVTGNKISRRLSGRGIW
jgi:putative aldouronate transport system permease protein